MRRATAAAASLLALSIAALSVTPAGGALAQESGGSAITVSGTGEFGGLQVTVGKTKNLVNEVVPVTWTGGKPTTGNFTLDYLQIMQCWGDASTGPTREQCQYGGLVGDNRGGAQVASRQVTYDITDPKETYKPEHDGQLRYVPFTSVTGKTKEGALSEFFDRNTTNEVPFGRTRGDGTGFVPFEMQTGVEAPGLGCGQVPATSTATIGRSCWLVVVPRGETEVDGSKRTDDSSNQLLSSPLSQTNWDHRIVVPLQFAPVGQPCPLGKAERPVVGNENSVEAVSSYQPVLCAGSGPVFSLNQVPDALARRQITGDAPGLSLTAQPLAPSAVPPGRKILYAPMLVSGITFAFNIESQASFSAPADVQARNGQPIEQLDLTPRLVAKLLTQSYQLGAAKGRPGLDKNPLDLTRDKEFLAVNPRFAQLRYAGIADVVVPSGLSDAAGLVWRWILSDPDARAFLAGKPDPNGMVVNPAYKGLTQQDGFPKADTVCETFPDNNHQPPLCTLDAHPYAGDTHEGARGAARGDTLARSFYDATAQPPTYKKQAPQPSGSRAIIALTDTATAARFGLQTARLRNAGGGSVAPTPAALLSAVAAMHKSADGDVLLADPTTKSAAAYPLTQLTYAIATPDGLPAGAGKDYAAFLRYAVGRGQQPGIAFGDLPPGYAPLPAALRAESLSVAKVVAAGPTKQPADAVPGDEAPAAPSGEAPTSAGTPLQVSPPGSSLADALKLPPTTPGPAPAEAPVPALIAAGGSTPAIGAGADSYAVPVCLALGGIAAAAGTALRRTASRLRRKAVSA